MKEQIKKFIQDSIEVKKALLKPEQLEVIEKMAKKIIAACAVGKKVLVFGNGGSASDAQHFVGELVCRLHMDRKPLPAISLNSNVAAMTAIANDYGYDEVFARQVEALAQQTGGLLFRARRVEDLEGAYRRVAVELRTFYSLAYTPANAVRDGRWHKVEVKVDRPGIVIRTRPGYYAK